MVARQISISLMIATLSRSGNCMLAMISPNGPVLTPGGVCRMRRGQGQQRKHQFGEAIGFLEMRIAGQDEGIDAERRDIP